MVMENAKKVARSYKVSQSRKEILDVIFKAEHQGQSLMWQTRGEQRTLFQIHSFELCEDRKVIRIHYEISQGQIDVNFPLFIKLSFRETVFKGIVTTVKENAISVEIPTEIHMREFRKSIRTTFEPGKNQAYIRSLKAVTQDKHQGILKVFINDISDKGLGLYISENNIHLFQKGQIIELHGLDGIGFPGPLKGKVAWTSRTHSFSTRKYGVRIGVEMEDVIPQSQLEELLDLAVSVK